MCGILGLVSSTSPEHQVDVFRLFTALFVSSSTRGKDASGFAAIYGKNKEEGADRSLLTDKRPLKSDNFIMDSQPFLSMRQDMPNLMIAHTRASTSGTPTRNRNNHPFHNQRYSLVHNGIIDDWKATALKHDLKMRTETDSEVLIRLLEGEPVEAITAMMTKVEEKSRIATAIIDRREHHLYLCRANNPIFILPIKEWKVIMFASTEDIIKTAIKYCGENFKFLENAKIMNTDIDKIYKFGFGENGNPKLLLDAALVRPTKTVIYQPPKHPIAPFISDMANVQPMNSGRAAYNPSTGHLIRTPVPSNIERSHAIIPVIQGLLKSPVMTDVERKHFQEWYSEE